jgi:excisionase family DNA binding protein
MQELKRLYTVQEVAQYFNVTDHAIWKWIRAGELPAIVVKRTVGIRWEDLQEFIMQHRTTAQ